MGTLSCFWTLGIETCVKLGRIPPSASFWGRFSLKSPAVLPLVCEVLAALSCHTLQKEGGMCCALCSRPQLFTDGQKSMLLTKLLKDFRFSAAALVFGDQNNVSS